MASKHAVQSEPVLEAGRLLLGMLLKKGVEGAYQLPQGVLPSPRIPGGTHKDQTMVTLASLVQGVSEGDEVDDILGHQRTTLLLSHGKDLMVIERAQLGAFRHGADVVSPPAELLGDRGRVHLVDEKPHPSASRARSQVSCWRSASRRLASMRSSISSRKSP